MIDVGLVVQDQRVIPVAPIIADTLFAIDNERVDLQLAEPRRGGQPGLPASNDQDGGIAVCICGGRNPFVEPVRAVKVARIDLALRTPPAGPLFVSLEFFKHRQQRPRLWRSAAGRVRDKTQNAAAAAFSSLKTEDRLDRRRSGTRHASGRRARRVDFKTARPDMRRGCQQTLGDYIGARHRLDGPRK
jgi:hypothetical protein